MSINLVIKADAPLAPYACELVEIQPEAVPFLLYGVFHKLQKYYWASHSDWIEGRRLMAMEGAQLLMTCGNDIVNGLDRIYNLLDVRLAGIERSVTGTGTDVDPFVYVPPIEQAATMVPGVDESLLLYANVNHQSWLNLLNGTAGDTSSDTRNIRQQLEDLILSVGATDDLDDEILAKLVEIALLLA
jgi:hypothetical protein